jgi:hypothetical protein
MRSLRQEAPKALRSDYEYAACFAHSLGASADAGRLQGSNPTFKRDLVILPPLESMQFSSRSIGSHVERDRSGNHTEQDQAILSRSYLKAVDGLGALKQLRNTPVIRTSGLKHL